MKKPSVMIGTPTADGRVVAEYVMSLVGSIQYMAGKYGGGLMIYRSPLISSGRNEIADQCKADYLMFIDSDIIFPPNGIERLMASDRDIIGGVYYSKNVPNEPIVYNLNKKTDKFVHITELKNELFTCDGIGTGFMLIKRRVLDAFTPDVVRKLGKPFNMMQKRNGFEVGEDLAFCKRAKKLGFEIWADPTIPLGHVGGQVVRLNNFLANLELKKIYQEKLEYKDHKIEGWMGLGELDFLYKQAKKMESVAEVGSWKGRSTHALLSGCPGTVYAIDHFKGSIGEGEMHKEAKTDKVYRDFMKNVGHFKNLKVLKMDSNKAVKKFKDKSVDMVFIDGGHTYSEVKNDILKWLPKTKKLICGHDYNWASVRQAVDETLGVVKVAGVIWFKEL